MWKREGGRGSVDVDVGGGAKAVVMLVWGTGEGSSGEET